MQFGHGFAGKADSSRASPFGRALRPSLVYYIIAACSLMALHECGCSLWRCGCGGGCQRGRIEGCKIAADPRRASAAQRDHRDGGRPLAFHGAVAVVRCAVRSEGAPSTADPGDGAGPGAIEIRSVNAARRDQGARDRWVGRGPARVWGSYQHNGPKWQISVRVLNVAAGNASRVLQAEGPDWFAARDGVCRQILQELGVNPTATERRKMKEIWTGSPAPWRLSARRAR